MLAGAPDTNRSRRRARARAPVVPPRAVACKILYTIMSHLTNRPACCRRRGRSISTARHADESSSSARATSAATHELDACALAIGQSHSAWMPRATSVGRIARRARRVRRRDQKECRTARTRRRGPSDAADGRRGPGPAVRSGPARAPAASCTTTPYQPMERVAAAAFAARSKALDSLDGRCRCPGSLKSAVRRRRHRRGRPPAERTSPRSVAGVAICRHGRQLLGVDDA